MNKKLLYEAPEAEILVVKFEENFCASPVDANYTLGGGGTYNPDRMNDNGSY